MERFTGGGRGKHRGDLRRGRGSRDAVVAATPDHTHAAVVMAAIELGKHVYCEKPLAHSLYEARRVTEAARAKGVRTQLGNQGHSFSSIRRFCEMIWSGVIGQVREIHAFCRHSYCPSTRVRPKETPPPPKTLDWDLWLGPAMWRPYHPVYLPGKWRGWVPFGTGIVGDWVCHVVDPVFWALGGGPGFLGAGPGRAHGRPRRSGGLCRSVHSSGDVSAGGPDRISVSAQRESSGGETDVARGLGGAAATA